MLTNYVQNLTSSYADKSNEVSIVTTSSVMFVLAALFFILSLFSRVSDVSAVLNPTVRLFLSSALSLFLPVMSYLFSEAKNNPSDLSSGPMSSGQQPELSLWARTILSWMLLVELLRKKVETILVNTTSGVQGYSSTIEHASRIVWLGYLVYFNVKSAGQKTIYGFLWVLAASELIQRVTISEVLKRSFACGKNAQRLHSYMAHILLQDHEDGQQENDDAAAPTGADLLMRCRYAVMGEEELEMEATGLEGYEPNTQKIKAESAAVVVTVGKIWTLAEGRDDDDDDPHLHLRGDQRLKRLCLSFALHKLLRRRFENFHFTDAEVHSYRGIIFRGLCNDGTDRDAIAVALFKVLHDELHFVCEYYHSVVPVVASSPFFLITNYLLFPIIVAAFFLLNIIVCNNGDLFYAFKSIRSDNLVISTGINKIVRCLFHYIKESAPALYSTVDLAITMLLALAFIYQEFWEFVVFIFSNWFMVSLIHHYVSNPHRHLSPAFKGGVINSILRLRSTMSQPSLQFNQLFMLGGLGFRRHTMLLKSKAVPKEVKRSIMEYLVKHIDSHAPLSNGWSMLQSKYPDYHSQLSWACQSDSITEVILTWHIATSILEAMFPKQRGATMSFQSHRTVATTLSRYCAYLVAFSPELLANNLDSTHRLYDAMKKEMKAALGCWLYYLPQEVPGSGVERWRKVMQVGEEPPPVGKLEAEMSAVWKGGKAGSILVGKAKLNEAPVWKLLADIWTEVIVYAAPSRDEVHVKAHGDALAHGGVEFISVLWALTTHAGVTRPRIKPWALITIDNLA
ncbi:hypothetical protein E2562_016246 [Oryza meyeriana var. granulata]|uniref:DUF4220 domain-containing protein n=1 Tax=Oryza meyeriana var. granulata TaxID=110450 RepID=A0A6G1CQS0_9ORYZ|nr:hypothetical protein E2562_016246 [Oryza meyeriana var. granulata]